MSRWPEPVEGAYYKIVSGGYGKGKVGVCDGVRRNGFGMVWAHLIISPEEDYWVRTVMLRAEGGHEGFHADLTGNDRAGE